MTQKTAGQSLAEYAIVLGIIGAVLMVIGPSFRWSAQQVLKSTADELGFQAGAEQAAKPEDGFLNMMTSNSRITSSGTESDVAGLYNSTETQQTNLFEESYTNGAFVQQ